MITDYIGSQVNMLPSFKECPLCHSTNTEISINIVLSTDPCTYQYHCKECNGWFLGTDYLVKPTLATPEFNYPTGWVCPKCGAVMSPTQSTCIYCTPPWTPTVTYGSGGPIGGICDPNITIKGTGSNTDTTGTITIDEDFLKELLKNNIQGKKK